MTEFPIIASERCLNAFSSILRKCFKHFKSCKFIGVVQDSFKYEIYLISISCLIHSCIAAIISIK